jgi:uncharacterized repeat protein (TIGR01451 family)
MTNATAPGAALPETVVMRLFVELVSCRRRGLNWSAKSDQSVDSTIVRIVLLVTLLAAIAMPPLRSHAQSAQSAQPTPPFQKLSQSEIVAGEILVRFRVGSSIAKTNAKSEMSLRALDHSIPVEINPVSRGMEIVPGLRLARVPADETASAISALNGRADVLYAEPNYRRHAQLVPNDSHYGDLWALKNAAPGGAGISAESAWNTTTGNHSVVVGVVDTGIDTGHLDLKDNIFVNQGEIPNNGIDDDGDGFIDDVNGWDFFSQDRTVFDSPIDDAHGTHVAGTIGARGNNSTGVVGVNWDVQILPLKALGPDGGTDASLIAAFQYARMLRDRGVNLRVLNNSYGGQGFSQSLRDAIKALGDAGILFVAAAGNDTLNNDFVPEYPASYDLPNVISVAASDQFGGFASSISNRGAQTVHLVAPGLTILSTTPRGYTGNGIVSAYTETDGSTYANFSGTSMATAHVAGAAALACAANPAISMQKLRAALLFNGDFSGVFSTLTITGRRLNANQSVQAALENDTTPPAVPANFRVNSQSGRRVELRWTEAGDDGNSSPASLDEFVFKDATSGEEFKLNSARPLTLGTEHSLFVWLPFKHTAGQITLSTFDNVGNSSTATVGVTVPDAVADPYTVTNGPPATLTPPNSGTRIGVKGDDTIFQSVNLPFPFPFFGQTTSNIGVSSNGALYLPIPPEFAVPTPNVGSNDGAVPTIDNLAHLAMIAGMWSDLRTDRHADDDVYLVQPDRDHVILRWQAVIFGSETPASFEIELGRDGTIQTRYGAGNQNLNPVVVGISGGDPSTYVVPTHTSETSPLSLSSAPSITFALKNPPPPPTTDLAVTATASPNPLVSGQNVSFNIVVSNLGPNTAEDLVMTDALPAGTTFVSCQSAYIAATCTGPPVGTNGTVTGRISTLEPTPGGASPINFTIVANVTAAAGTVLQNTASATSFRTDPNPANNSATSSSTVVAESFFNAARAISAGWFHTTSLRNDATVWNWGRGDNGQLGDGNSGIGVRSVTPVQVNGLGDVIAISDGAGFVLALRSDGTVWSWGANEVGQLGDGTTTQRTRPVQVVNLTNVVAISADHFYGAAVKNDGTVWLWGYTPLFNQPNSSPVQLPGISNVAAISAGEGHLLMIKTDKTAWAVGSNARGELGDGTTTSRTSPVQVSGLTNVAHIASGGDEFSVAVKDDGTVWAWGINNAGELGPGGGSVNFDPHPIPIQVTGLPAGIQNVATGGDFVLTLAADGTIWSWGSNDSFQLGHGTSGGQNLPKQIPNFTNVTAIAAGLHHSVALNNDGSVWTWGSNSEGELGDGTTTMHLTPAKVSGLEAVGSPSFNPSGGSFTTAVDVTVTCATPGATIHFTTNATEPTENDPIIASGTTIHLTGFAFLQAKAWKPGLIPSSVSFARFDINIPTNPIDQSLFFVSEHYQDFLNRQPDQSGLDFWTGQITSCGSDAVCIQVKRINVSAAFFLSIEFQQTGYLVERMYKVAYGDSAGNSTLGGAHQLLVPAVRFDEFLKDTQRIGQGVVVLQPGWEQALENNKQAYAGEFVATTRFIKAFPTAMTPAQFVDSLNQNAGNVLSPSERTIAINLFAGAADSSNTAARVQALRQVAEDQDLYNSEFDRAFVLSQYIGYLRRNPNDTPDSDYTGYEFWLNKLNQYNGDYLAAEMVKAFISSNEYRHRFGP